MAKFQTQTDPRVLALLNDLLQLDHDAVQAYTLALQGLRSAEHKATLTRFRADHERHIRDLTEVIESHGGTPIQLSHIPTGAFKLAVQALGNLGSDREVLLAFKSNERQVRDKYVRLADESNVPDVAELLSRNAADEEKHYRWVTETLAQLGVGPDTAIGAAEDIFERVHARNADLIEGVERKAMEQVVRVRRSPLLWIAVGIVGFWAIRRMLR